MLSQTPSRESQTGLGHDEGPVLSDGLLARVPEHLDRRGIPFPHPAFEVELDDGERRLLEVQGDPLPGTSRSSSVRLRSVITSNTATK